MKIVIHTKMDFKKYVKLMFALTYRKGIMILFIVLASISFIGLLSNLVRPFPVGPTTYMQIGYVVLVLVVIPLMIYFRAKKNFESNERLHEDIMYEFKEEGIKVTGESFTSEMDWSKIFKVKEMKHWILMYQNRQVANVIPKESFGDNISEFRELVRTKNIKSKFK